MSSEPSSDARQSEQLRAEIRHLQMRLIASAMHVLDALKGQKVEDAPLNQLTSALGALLDRYLKLEAHRRDLEARTANEGERVYRIEYRYPDGSIHQTPPWAETHPRFSRPFQSRGLRQTLREDGDGEDRDH